MISCKFLNMFTHKLLFLSYIYIGDFMFYNKYISKVIIFFLIFILNFTSGYVYADDVDVSDDYVSEDLLDSFSSEASNVFENSLNLNFYN